MIEIYYALKDSDSSAPCGLRLCFQMTRDWQWQKKWWRAVGTATIYEYELSWERKCRPR